MKKITISLVLILISFCDSWSQKQNLSDVTIVRDSFGVPHIFGETNDQVAYGLAWVQCEDQFKTMQEILAACRGVLGEIKGKDGVVADIGIQFMGIAEFVKHNYEKEVQGAFRNYLESYVAGVNDYARSHRSRVLTKKLFPITPQDVLTGYLLGNVEISGAGRDLQRILSGRISSDLPKPIQEKGSNAFAFGPGKTKDGKTYLAINSHQPLEGWYSWYEAHLHSKEGLNIIGATFAGGVSIFLGANERLGWAHTVNHPDLSDVYRLTVNSDETAYLVDNEWKPLIKKKAKAKVKLLGLLKIPVSRAFYLSDYGPTFRTESGEFYAWRFMAGQTLKMAEQWWQMNLATNLDEFKEALRIRGIISTNIVYADVEGNIYYVSNARTPKRNPKYKWAKVLPGNTKETMTDPSFLLPFDSLPQVLNPECGWVFNTNNTPFTASCKENSPTETGLNDLMGFQESGDENNRSLRFLELMEDYSGKVDYEDFKKIKYDGRYPSEMVKVSGVNVNVLFEMDPTSFPEVEDLLTLLQRWDRNASIDSEGAGAFLTTIYAMNEHKRKRMSSEKLALRGLQEAKASLLKNFGKVAVPLGQIQRHTRGEVSLAIAGAPDVLTAMYGESQKNGTFRAIGGESYIELVQFGKEGVMVESINAFGNSEVEGHPYSTSQMKHYASQKLKKMSFNKDEVMNSALKIYHPETSN